LTSDDLLGVSSLLNVGHLVSDPRRWSDSSARAAALQLWKIALGVTLPALHGSAWVQVALNRLGADPVLVPDGSLGQRSRNALKAFQDGEQSAARQRNDVACHAHGARRCSRCIACSDRTLGEARVPGAAQHEVMRCRPGPRFVATIKKAGSRISGAPRRFACAAPHPGHVWRERT